MFWGTSDSLLARVLREDTSLSGNLNLFGAITWKDPVTASEEAISEFSGTALTAARGWLGKRDN